MCLSIDADVVAGAVTVAIMLRRSSRPDKEGVAYDIGAPGRDAPAGSDLVRYRRDDCRRRGPDGLVDWCWWKLAV